MQVIEVLLFFLSRASFETVRSDVCAHHGYEHCVALKGRDGKSCCAAHEHTHTRCHHGLPPADAINTCANYNVKPRNRLTSALKTRSILRRGTKTRQTRCTYGGRQNYQQIPR